MRRVSRQQRTGFCVGDAETGRHKSPLADRSFGGGRPRPPRRVSWSETGFTLVEILVSTVFLTLAFLALVAVFAAARVSTKKAYYTVRASTAAASKIDIYRGAGHDGISGTSTDTVSDLPSGNQVTSAVTAYDRVSNSTGLKMVTTTVDWPGSPDASYEAGRLQLQTLIANRASETSYRTKRGY